MMFYPPFSNYNYYRSSYRPIRNFSDNSNFYNNAHFPPNKVNSSIHNYSVDDKEKRDEYKKVESKTSSSTDFDLEYFEILGIKLYFDDILLICMIFFLYNEGVKDQMLFISLILLLLS